MNDFSPEVRSLFHTLKKHKFSPYMINNGEELIRRENTSHEEFIGEIIEVDECYLYVKNQENKKFMIFLVLGNEPGEIAADYSDNDSLSAALDEHYNRWENRKQPIKWFQVLSMT